MADLIPPEELKITALSHPPGGQHVGTPSGITVEHLPTGIKATVKTHRSQFRNKAIAIEMIEAALTSPHFR